MTYASFHAGNDYLQRDRNKKRKGLFFLHFPVVGSIELEVVPCLVKMKRSTAIVFALNRTTATAGLPRATLALSVHSPLFFKKKTFKNN